MIETIIGAVILVFFGIFFGLLYKGIDRKLHARMQARIGPPIRQPFRDVAKLMCKENIVPENAVGWMFNAAPVIALASSATILLYLPIGPFGPLLSTHGDLILVLYLLIVPALALVAGGFASGSPYATVGAQREMVMMIAYEFPLAVVVITAAWKLNVLGVGNPFSFLSLTANPLWGSTGILGIIGLGLLLVVLVIVTPAELSKIPFDAPEAETEIVGGLLVEYSGRNLALFYLADAVKSVVMCSLVVAIFFPWNLSSILGLAAEGTARTIIIYTIDMLFFLLKLFVVLYVSVTMLRTSFARFKIDQIVHTYWASLTIIALFGLVLVIWDMNLIASGLYSSLIG